MAQANDANDLDDTNDDRFHSWLQKIQHGLKMFYSRTTPQQEHSCIDSISHADQDSDYDSDEAKDTFGELPGVFDVSVAIVFVIDAALAMGRQDIVGSGKRRIDVVLDVITKFITHQRSAGATSDRYSLVTYKTGENYTVAFRAETAESAMRKLGTMDLEVHGYSNYGCAFRAVSSAVVKFQRTRVVLLSSPNAGDPERRAFDGLLEMVTNNPKLDIHTLGLGEGDFSYLQQIAQIGRGTFNRASMDVDKLVNTFTSVSVTLTQTRGTDHVSERPTRVISFEGARINNFSQKTDTALRHTFYLKDGKMKANKAVRTRYQMRRKPCMQGGMRLVYRFQDLDILTRTGAPLRMVAKKSKYATDDCSWDYVNMFVRNTVEARAYSNKFHDAVSAAIGDGWEPPRTVSVAQCFAYETSHSIFVAEPFLSGAERGFFKWINNRGEILIPKQSCEYVMAAETFAHFTLVESNGELMVADVQGVRRGKWGASGFLSLTDPQIVSKQRGAFGAADLGPCAMQKFSSLHVCNDLCRALCLPSSSSLPRAPRIRDAISGISFKDPVRKSRPDVNPIISNQLTAQRGRSPTACHDNATVAMKLGEETVTADTLLLLDSAQARKLLFVGEYTHSFSAAAAKFVAGKLGHVARGVNLDWCSTAWNWPEAAHLKYELQSCRQYLQKCGVQTMQGVDATNLQLEIDGLQGAIWVMAFPRDKIERSKSAAIRAKMQQEVDGFVRSVSRRLEREKGRVSIVFMAMQHLAWKLSPEVTTPHGIFMREVFWLDLNPLLQNGYTPRFGDARDSSRSATYHKHDEVVVAQWRYKKGDHDTPGGMTDQRIRSVSASRRSSSRSCSPGR